MKIRSIFTLSPEVVQLLQSLSKETGLKMSTIVEQGIKKMGEKYEN